MENETTTVEPSNAAAGRAEFALLYGKWQTIETAPKDGKNIIGFTGHGVEVVRWCDWNGREYAPGDGWIGVEQDSTCLTPNYRREKAQHQPTHWMPLPNPPNDV